MKHVKRLLIVGIVAVLLLFFLKDLDFKSVMENIKHVNVLYLVLFVMGLYLQYFLRAWRWGILLKPHKDKIPLMTLYNYTVIGFMINIILPGKVGEAARGVLLAQEIEIPRSYGLASVLLERLIDFLMIIVIFWGSLFFLSVEQTQHFGNLKQISFYIFPFVVLLFVFFYFINSRRMAKPLEWIITTLAKVLPSRLRERAVESGHRFVKGLRLNLSFFNTVKLMAASLIVWLFLLPWYWLMMKAFTVMPPDQAGRAISDIGLLESVPYFSAIVVSASIPTPGMAGSFHVVSQQTLDTIYHVNKVHADAYTILVYFLIMLVMIVPGAIAFFKKGITLDTIRSIRKKKKEGDEGEAPGTGGAETADSPK